MSDEQKQSSIDFILKGTIKHIEELNRLTGYNFKMLKTGKYSYSIEDKKTGNIFKSRGLGHLNENVYYCLMLIKAALWKVE